MVSQLAASSDLIGNLGGILGGLSELLLAIGAGFGFVIRSRRAARRERRRTETAAALAATEAKRVLEERLENQHREQVEGFKQQILDLQGQRNDLLQRLLDRQEDEEEHHD